MYEESPQNFCLCKQIEEEEEEEEEEEKEVTNGKNASFFFCDDDDDSRFVFDDVEFLEVFSEKRRWQQEQREEDGNEDVFWKSPNNKKMESPIERHFVYRKEQEQ